MKLMKITFFSVVMSILWGSALMLIFAALRKKKNLTDICSVTGIVILYVFCAVRMLIPIELPWVIVIPNESIYNPLYRAVRYTLPGGFTIIQALAAIWVIGAAIALIRLGVKYYRLAVKIREMKAKSVPVSAVILEATERVRVYKTNEADVPIAVGVLNGVIIIPDRDFAEKELELIIRHEYTHIKNRDLLIQLLANILCAIYWWNPAVYLFRKDLEQYFELRCDKTVTAGMSKKETAEYLDVLLKIYNAGQLGVSINTVGVIENYKAGGKELKERFERISEVFEKRSRQYMGRMAVVVITVCLLVASYMFIIQSNYDAPEMEEGAVEVSPENAYIVRLKDGSFVLRMNDGFQKEISKESIEMLVQDGFTVKQE